VENTALISLDEGKFHQVKRMFRAIGYEVINLKRIQIGKYHLGNLEPGEYVEIKKDDIL
jgi:16S rRNA pseudouridine516 synthase